jgi:hypothetical protein
MLLSVKNRLPGSAQFSLIGDRAAGVRITVETGEIAAGYFYAYAVSRQKGVARDSGVDHDPVYLAWSRRLGALDTISITQAQNAIA